MRPGFAVRLWLAAHTTVPLGLLATTLLQQGAPAAWSPLHSRPAWPTWACLAAWAVAAVLLACWPRTVAMWRGALLASAMLLVATAVAGGVAGAAGWLEFGCALCGLGAAAGWVALRWKAAVPSATGRRAAVAPAPPPPSRLRPSRGSSASYFVLAAGCGVYAFWVARSAAPPLERAAGMAGMLVAFFLLLPAATVRVWSVRCAVVLLLAASALFAGLAWRTDRVAWVAWALCTAVLAGAAAWRARSVTADEATWSR